MMSFFSFCCSAEDVGAGATVEFSANDAATGARADALAVPSVREEKREEPPLTEESSFTPPPKDNFEAKEVRQHDEVRQHEKVIMVTVKKTEDKPQLGLDLGHRKTDYLTVKHVLKDGLVSAWNATASEDNQVKALDQIVEINGKSGAENMLEVIKGTPMGGELTLKMKRKVAN
eukprot:TRINITY_DN77754_c0_g1_i1.p1 TRINITY_DN77754_c0_g1~~TRINITY_DN77754_c0_g1_i1.p1  ORF type:complete len:174 (-),score=54.35 TRINITY_DN77754_c0_g1_i1:181-702(-)